ncbi:MAG: T9SS type A sorting domain-containing protein [Candidatus Kapabacteria bacterium]|nr:T9SS type A sorting domain-containing protein [Candidatus Kapabacteria bacterium]
MRNILLLVISLTILGTFDLQADINYSEHIAPIIYKNCTSCHRSNEIGPMPFTSYSEVRKYGQMIKSVTSNKSIPPWQPTKSFSTFINERGLTDIEIKMIADWTDADMPQGDPSKEPALPQYSDGSQLGTPDLVLKMSEAFTQKGDGKDIYWFFVLPSGLTEDKEIAAIEFRPGNKKIVHHVLMAIDTSGKARAKDKDTPGYGYIGFGGFGDEGLKPIVGYVPGASPTVFPDGIGLPIQKNSDLVIQVHYAPSPIDQTDQSTVNIFFRKDKVERHIQNFVMLPIHLKNGPFIMKADSITSFRGEYKLPIDVTLFAVGPHSHLLNKYWRVVAVNEKGDSIPLIEIKDWKFNWQSSYFFKKPVVLKKGSKLIGWATYDNTVNNYLNPNNPPKLVTWGENTSDEMYYLPFFFTTYKAGDENIVLSVEEGNDRLILKQNLILNLSPNPVSNDYVTLSFEPNVEENAEIEVFDISGRNIKELNQSYNLRNGEDKLNLQVEKLQIGTYVIKLKSKNYESTVNFVKSSKD